jgi:hypothetical protein
VRFGPAATTRRTKVRRGSSGSAALDQAELGHVAGDGDLRGRDAALLQRAHEVVLRGDLLLRDGLEDRGLPRGLADGGWIFIHFYE